MYAERRDASERTMAAWLERLTARVRELENENAQLKQQLADLRSGQGIAVVIEGTVVPLARQPTLEPSWQHPATLSQPREGSPALYGVSPQARLMPVPSGYQRQHPPAVGPHPSFGPLASTPDELPKVRGLLPAPQQPRHEWLGTGEAWPETPAHSPQGHHARTLGQIATPAPAATRTQRGPVASSGPVPARDHQWRRNRAQDERNPFANSFLL